MAQTEPSCSTTARLEDYNVKEAEKNDLKKVYEDNRCPQKKNVNSFKIIKEKTNKNLKKPITP